MAYLLGQLHFWTLNDDAVIFDSDIGCHSYHGKGSKGNQTYYEQMKTFTEDRGLVWSPGKKRPEKIRDELKEVEELLSTFRCVYCAWCERNRLQMMFNNGMIVVIRVKAGIGDIEKIQLDRFLVGKLHSDHVVDVVFNDSSILISYVDPKLTHVQFSKKVSSDERSSKKWEKLSSVDAKISNIDLMGPMGRRLERKLSCNVQKDQIVIWWKSGSDEVWPWTPIASDRERANIHVYSMNSGEIKISCYTRTKSDPLWVSFSRLHSYQFHTIEQKVSRRGEILVDMCVYEVIMNKIQQISVTTIPLESLAVCHGMNEMEDRFLLGCKDGSLVMYDAHCKTTWIVKASFVPTTISWHPSGTIVMVSDDKGQFQCYDMALCCIHLQLLSERTDPVKVMDLSTYFKLQPNIQKLLWNPYEYLSKDANGYLDNTHSLLFFIERGPLVLFVLKVGVHSKGSLSPIDLVAQYITYKQFDEAVNLLLNMNWNINSDTCCRCLSMIVNNLLRTNLTDESEVQLEKALGSFYSPLYPLSDVVLLEYGTKMRHLARRFFHHLLRFEKFEKAFLLAADIGSRDLFMDIHYVAIDKGERILAQVAIDRARQLEQGSDLSSVDSRLDGPSGSSCSSYSDEDSDLSYDESKDLIRSKEPTIRPSTSALKVSHGHHNHVSTSSNQPSYKWPSATKMAQHQTGSTQRMSQSEPSADETFEEDDEEGHGTVHVVHFGVV